ncbi:hypothetical protein MNBD_PLANCTO02-575 [hydrothermal vent metagenome]|uniref:DUF1549 domain-containing protein n=1 Tax=hydrothermal vent metagenome TaxID=652676 RepID=A0A3B1E6A3_9ZZZZ
MKSFRTRISHWSLSGIVTAVMVCSFGLLFVASGNITPSNAASPVKSAPPKMKLFLRGKNLEIVNYINKQIQQGWKDNEITPSEMAEDAEWLRRIYLDLVGHIPPANVVEKFLANKDEAKRSKMVGKLLDDPGYVRNLTTVWTNLTIGRRTPRRVSRSGMEKFLREAFARNRPWNKVVYDIVSAEGHFEENGAVNYLLAQMVNRDDGVQMTAKTTRLFMGVQVQCTQCHNHPFNDWKQNQFWEFNSFFRQTRKIDHRKYDAKRGRRVDDYSEIVSRNFSGPVYYEKRSGLMQVAYPKFFGEKVKIDEETDRRKELAKLMTSGGEPWVARAMVNRMWGHFMGYGFTKPVDDMGPHNPASHPELLERLTNEFVASKYDVKQLIRWICNSDAYSLSSRFGKSNKIDNPAAGETPLFSHMYVKSMQAEQLYDSLIIATNAHKSGRSNWSDAERQRQRWMQQFIVAFDTDENDEATTFNGTIPQALMMMNGELVQNAISVKKGGYLRTIMESRGSNSIKIKKLYLSTLGRNPSRREKQMAMKMMKRSRDKIAAYQDLYWALLNSNAFIFNY